MRIILVAAAGAARGVWRCPPARPSAADAQGLLRLRRPAQRRRLQPAARHRPARCREGRSATRSMTELRRERAGGADAEHAIDRLAQIGCGIIFTTSFGFMERPTLKVAGEFPNVKFEHATGFKTAAERVDLQHPLVRRPLRHGPDRGQDVEDGRRRLHRLVPDSRSGDGHRRLHARRAVGQPGLQGQDRLGEHLVRPGQGRRRRQDADRPGRRRHRPAHRLAGADADRREGRRARASASRPTCRSSARTRTSPR